MTWLIALLEAALRIVAPFVACLALAILSEVPLYLPGYGAVAPDLLLMGVFYWSIYRPSLLPSAVVFVIGLVQDALVGVPFGVNALVLVLVQGVVTSQRRFFHGKSFVVVWWAFLLVAWCAGTLSWVLMMVLNQALMDPTAGVFQAALTVALYPFFALALAWLQRTAPSRA